MSEAVSNSNAGNGQTSGPHRLAQDGPPPPVRIVPKHGGGLLKVPQKGGLSPNPSGVGGSAYHETMSLARKASPRAMERLIALAESNDPRVAFVAAQAIVERAWGKAAAFNPTGDKAKATFDLSRLSLQDLRALMSVMEAARVPDAASEEESGPVVDGSPDG